MDFIPNLRSILLLLLTAAAVQSKFLGQVQIHDSELTLWDTKDKGIFACSANCLPSPDCKAIVWSDNICKHGFPTFKRDRSGQIITVYMTSLEKKVLEFLAKLSDAEDVRRESKFEPNQWAFREKLYWRSKKQVLLGDAKEECERFGRILAVLYDKDVFEFLLDNDAISTEAQGSYKSSVIVGLERNSNTSEQCVLSECDHKMTWADGESFVFQPHFPCTDINFPERDKGFVIFVDHGPHDYSLCTLDLGQFEQKHWRLSDFKPDMKRKFLCQFEL